MLVAADTYRAAAIDQIKIWAKRLNIKLLANELILESLGSFIIPCLLISS